MVESTVGQAVQLLVLYLLQGYCRLIEGSTDLLTGFVKHIMVQMYQRISIASDD
jgi:hypothetical protein